MVNKEIAIAMYIQGFKLAEIGRFFHVSRQRAWQVIKPFYKDLINKISKRQLPNNMVINPRPEEVFVFNKLTKIGLKPKYSGYNSPFDISVKNKKIQIKFRTTSVTKNKRSLNEYFVFGLLTEKIKPDFYIFICGTLDKAVSYILRGDEIKTNTYSIPKNPYQKKTKRFFNKHANNWALIK